MSSRKVGDIVSVRSWTGAIHGSELVADGKKLSPKYLICGSHGVYGTAHETTDPITCKRCIRSVERRAKPPKKPRSARKTRQPTMIHGLQGWMK